MRNLARFALCVLAFITFAQGEESVEKRLAALTYPELARRTRIQGDVRVVIDAGEARVVSGNQMLSPGTVENARILIPGADSVEFLIHYQLVDGGTRRIQRRERKGNTFDRLILRLLHLPTFRDVDYAACDESRDNIPPTRADFTRNPMEVWIYGPFACVQPVSVAMR